MDKDIKALTDDALYNAIEEKYGKDWVNADIDDDDELIVEFFYRAQMGGERGFSNEQRQSE